MFHYTRSTRGMYQVAERVDNTATVHLNIPTGYKILKVNNNATSVVQVVSYDSTVTLLHGVQSRLRGHIHYK